MPRFLHTIPRVLVMLQPASPKVRGEKLQGILKYARLHGPWDVQVMEDRTFTSELGAFKNWRTDGIITRSSPEALDARAAAFIDRLKQNGHACAVYAPQNAKGWGLEQRHMRDWLKALPKPCGLFVAFDLRANTAEPLPARPP